MTTKININYTPANPWLDVLEQGYAWSDTGRAHDPVTISYFLANDVYHWSNTERWAYANALQAWANVANITFQQASTAAAADFVEYTGPQSEFDADEWEDHDGIGRNTYNFESFGWDDADGPGGSINTTGGLAVGGRGYWTMLQGIGNVLGLSEPFNGFGEENFPGVSSRYDDGDSFLNLGVFTVMSNVALQNPSLAGGDEFQGSEATWYLTSPPVANHGYFAGPSALDIRAIQDLYGANLNYRTGNDSYVLPDAEQVGTYWTCIWDAGGTDEIRYNGSRNAKIYLTTAFMSDDYASGGSLSQVEANPTNLHGGFTIAEGVTIENAFGGSGNDYIVGNDVANRIDGGAGSDRMYGGEGNDTYYVDNSGDKVVDDGGDADWVFSRLTSYALTDDPDANGGGVENINYVGPSSANFIGTGNSGPNEIIGWSGNDRIDGKGGADVMKGLGGNDTYYVDNVGDSIVETATSGTADWVHVTLTRFALGVYLENLNYVGNSSLAFTGTGNANANTIIGWGGGDVLNGLGGADLLQGLGGNDTLNGGNDQDTLEGGSGNDTLDGQGGTDALKGGDGNDSYMMGTDATDTISDSSGLDTVFTSINRSMTGYAGVENLVLQGTGNINGTGNVGKNGILGNSGNNILAGLNGVDALNGAGGNDYLFGQNGQDNLTGGLGNDTLVYQIQGDSPNGALCDFVYDFDDAGDDRIDLTAVYGPALTYIGTGAFTATGQVRINDTPNAHLVVEINLNANNANNEMQILLLNTDIASMAANDFLL